jgi:hypothetical protein
MILPSVLHGHLASHYSRWEHIVLGDLWTSVKVGHPRSLKGAEEGDINSAAHLTLFTKSIGPWAQSPGDEASETALKAEPHALTYEARP